MNSSKPFWKSKTYQGIVLSLLSGVVYPMYMAFYEGKPIREISHTGIVALVGLFGAGYSAYGRNTATKSINFRNNEGA